ncbi:MAG: hypothetical protein D6732_26395 [Methanobacteriota archaeon]|nr:MAG: hypothetical protein D6732_26395 [Euryarchaeota archaeon]
MPQIEEILVCPNCGEEISHEQPIHLVRRGLPRFKWWVAPLNLFLLSLLLIFIELGADGGHFDEFQWSFWAVGGIWLLYGIGALLSFRTDDAWILVPLFFIIVAAFLALLDLNIPTQRSNSILGLTWSYYPIVIILIGFVIMPLISFLGRKQKKPVELLREIVTLEESHKVEEE